MPVFGFPVKKSLHNICREAGGKECFLRLLIFLPSKLPKFSNGFREFLVIHTAIWNYLNPWVEFYEHVFAFSTAVKVLD